MRELSLCLPGGHIKPAVPNLREETWQAVLHTLVVEEDQFGKVLSALEQDNTRYSLKLPPECQAPGVQNVIVWAYAKSRR